MFPDGAVYYVTRTWMGSERKGQTGNRADHPGCLRSYFSSRMYFRSASICCWVSLPLYAGILFFPSETVFFSAECDIFATPGS
jgi:hypothetical protein